MNDDIKEKGKITLGKILNVNFIAFGIACAFALLIANIAGLYAVFGITGESLGYFWIIPTLIGLLFPPIIGFLSDKTETRFGKRLPYLVMGSLITSICLIIIPNSPTFIWVAIFHSLNIAALNTVLFNMRPFVVDVSPKEFYTKMYAGQIALSSLGGVLAYLLPYLLHFTFIGKGATHGVPEEIKIAFYIGAVILIISACWTFCSTLSYLPKNKNRSCETSKINFKLLFNFTALPRVFRGIALTNFFSWIGIFVLNIYLTPIIRQMFFSNSGKDAIRKSVMFTGISYAVYNVAGTIFACFFIPMLAKNFGRKSVLASSLIVGSVAMILFPQANNLYFLLGLMALVGIAYACVNSLPFAMIANVIPGSQIGSFMGLFNISTCLAQIVISVFSAGIIAFLEGNLLNYAAISGGFFLLAAMFTIFVKDG